jgi:hypothetical protein
MGKLLLAAVAIAAVVVVVKALPDVNRYLKMREL